MYSFFLSALRDCKKSISQVDQSLIILNDETLFSKPCRSGNCVHCLQRFRSDSGISKFGWCKQLLCVGSLKPELMRSVPKNMNLKSVPSRLKHVEGQGHNVVS